MSDEKIINEWQKTLWGAANDGNYKYLKIILDELNGQIRKNFKDKDDDFVTKVINWANPDDKGNTPLHVSRGCPNCINLLLEVYGININSTNNNGETPLVWAVRHGNITTVKRLVEAGAKIEIVPKRGKYKNILPNGIAKKIFNSNNNKIYLDIFIYLDEKLGEQRVKQRETDSEKHDELIKKHDERTKEAFVNGDNPKQEDKNGIIYDIFFEENYINKGEKNIIKGEIKGETDIIEEISDYIEEEDGGDVNDYYEEKDDKDNVKFKMTLLLFACYLSLPKVVKKLLQYPKINVNLEGVVDGQNVTPLKYVKYLIFVHHVPSNLLRLRFYNNLVKLKEIRNMLNEHIQKNTKKTNFNLLSWLRKGGSLKMKKSTRKSRRKNKTTLKNTTRKSRRKNKTTLKNSGSR